MKGEGDNQGQGIVLRMVSVFGATGAILIAFLGLLGYVPGLELLGSVSEGYVPMAPSTAISFIGLGSVLFVMAFRPLSGVSVVLSGALVVLVSLFGALEVTGHFTGWDLNFEDALVPAAGYLGEIPIGRMSPSTGTVFLIAGLAALALLRRGRTHGRQTRFGHWGGGLGSLVVVIGMIFCLAYLSATPFLYGQGATVPMALTTALAFLMLGAATVGVSGRGAIPLSLFAGTRRADRSMSERKKFLLLTLIMVGACAMVMVVISVTLYRHEIQQQRQMLEVTAKSQARLIEAVARFDARTAGTMREPDQGYDAAAATLSQIIDAHERYVGFGETGEFTLARREGENIVFVLRHRYGAVEIPEPVAFDSELAAAMRRALNGLSGTLIGLDYRGETVLAAYEPVAVLNLGIVAKIALAEIRTPFIRASFSAVAIAFLVVLAGAALFFRIGNPIIERLEKYSRDLEEEVAERSRLGDELDVKNKELEQIIYVASHDLRSPLVNVDGYSKELELAINDLRSACDGDQTPIEALQTVSSLLADDIPEALRFIRISASKMDTLLAGLLKLSRSGRAALTIDLLDMNELVANVVDASEFQIKEAGAEVNIDDLPPCKGDGVQVNQVFSNLLSNALKYRDPKRPALIRISGRVEGQRSVYCVEDNGIGIAPAHQQNVFDIFHQLNPAESEGEGLGLTIVQQVLGRLSGEIQVESEPGEGSRFYVALPTGWLQRETQ